MDIFFGLEWLIAPLVLCFIGAIPIAIDVYARKYMSTEGNVRHRLRVIATVLAAIYMVMLIVWLLIYASAFEVYMKKVLDGLVWVQIARIAFIVVVFSLLLSYLFRCFPICTTVAKPIAISAAAVSLVYFALEKNEDANKENLDELNHNIVSALERARESANNLWGEACTGVIDSILTERTAENEEIREIVSEHCRVLKRLADAISGPPLIEDAKELIRIGDESSGVVLNNESEYGFVADRFKQGRYLAEKGFLRAATKETRVAEYESAVRIAAKSWVAKRDQFTSTTGRFDEYLYGFLLLFLLAAVVQLAAGISDLISRIWERDASVSMEERLARIEKILADPLAKTTEAPLEKDAT